jgi:hypothetical protein
MAKGDRSAAAAETAEKQPRRSKKKAAAAKAAPKPAKAEPDPAKPARTGRAADDPQIAGAFEQVKTVLACATVAWLLHQVTKSGSWQLS